MAEDSPARLEAAKGPPPESKGFAATSLLTRSLATDCTTITYPSIGGLVIAQYTGCELDYLGLSRSEEAKPCPIASVEDNFAFKVLCLGGRWWPNWDFYSRHIERATQIPYGQHLRPTIDVGYPSEGGVWVLKTVQWKRSRLLSGLPERPDGWVKINMAWTMDKRCEVLKGFGATLYERKEDCLDIPKSLEKGIEAGRANMKLLVKVEDNGYVYEWLESRWDDIYKETEPVSE
jgi:hypothetical protein